MSSICIIPARGGSKRIPQKNIKEFCGKPIIAYSIEAALQSGLFDEVMVSTDDEKIARIAREYGASIPFMRSAGASGDYSATADVVIEVLGRYLEVGKGFDIVCSLYPTAPFVEASDLREAYSLVLGGAPSVLPVTSFDYTPYRALSMEGDGTIRYERQEYVRSRTQDLPVLLHDCGWFFMSRVDDYVMAKTAVMQGCKGLMVDPGRVQDIDTLQDWDLAERKYRLLKGYGE